MSCVSPAGGGVDPDAGQRDGTVAVPERTECESTVAETQKFTVNPTANRQTDHNAADL